MSFAHRGGDPVSRCPAYPELFCRSCGRQTSFNEFLCGGNRLRIQRRSARLSAAFPRRGDAVAGPLGDEPTLEMGDRAEHMEHELAGGRGGVEAFLETHEVDALGLEGVDGLD